MANKPTLAEKAAGIGADLHVRPRDPNAAPKTMPGHSMMFRSKSTEMQAEIDELHRKLLEAGKGVQKIALSRLHKVSGRQRNLTTEERSELRENLRHNPLITPITITLRADGDYDIVAGNNRYDIFLELGRDDIEAFIIEATPEQADVSAFYSNLLHPSLPDFEKYQGFRRRMDATGKSQKQIAEESGLSESSVSYLMAFGRLPEEARAALVGRPGSVGANAAMRFALMTEEGRSEHVIAAVCALVANPDLTQDQALIQAANAGKPTTTKRPAPKAQTFKLGKTTFAKVIGVDKVLRISFANEDDRKEMESEIETLISQYIEKRRSS